MKSYQPSRPRATFLVVAFAMTAITMGGLVVLPAELETVSANPGPTTATVVARVSTSEPRR
jgi:hypothetical protein